MLNRRQLLATAGAGTVALAMPSIARAAPAKVILAHGTADSHPMHIAALEFRKQVEALVPGATDIQIFGNRQLGGDKQNLESTIAGTVQVSLASGVLYPLVTGIGSLDAYQLPFLVRDYDHFEKLATSETADKILAELDPAGVVGLATIDIGQRNFLSAKNPVTKIEEFAGLKTRIVPVPLHKKIWEAMGTAPVGLAYGEVYSSLETKVLDAVEINVSSIVSENLAEVAKHFTYTRHYPWQAVVAMNKPFFDGLPGEVQAAVREAGKGLIAPTMAYTKQQEVDAVAGLQEQGLEVHQLSDIDAMRAKMAPIVDEWSAKSPLIAEFVEAARAS